MRVVEFYDALLRLNRILEASNPKRKSETQSNKLAFRTYSVSCAGNESAVRVRRNSCVRAALVE